jgi:hypothetical protein
MTREELEHIIRASADVTNQYEFVIIGSQSMLGQVPNPEKVFTVSMEADIYPRQAPDLADEIDGAIGEGSQFHETYGYYAQGVGPDTAILPKDWMTRVHRVQNNNTNGRVGYCLDVLDLFLAKAAAGRNKDREFCMALLEYAYLTPAQALELVPTMPLDDGVQRTLRAAIRRWAKALRDAGNNIPGE